MLKQRACHDSFKVIIADIARAFPVHCCYQLSDITATCLQHRHTLALGYNAFDVALVLRICLLHTEIQGDVPRLLYICRLVACV